MKRSPFAGKSWSPLKKLIVDEEGATIAEYALVAVFIGLAGAVIARLLPSAIRAYLSRIYLLVSSPFP